PTFAAPSALCGVRMPANAASCEPRSSNGSAKISPAFTFRPARSAIVEAHFDVRAIAHLSYPVLKRLVGLALADRDLCPDAFLVRGDVLLAPLENLDKMPAEGRAHRR